MPYRQKYRSGHWFYCLYAAKLHFPKRVVVSVFSGKRLVKLSKLKVEDGTTKKWKTSWSSWKTGLTSIFRLFSK